jgi:hypothetical protein
MTAVFSIVFAVVYALAYVVCVEANYALFTYHPATGEFGMFVQRPKDGPAMYWYGWMATSGIVAALAAGASTLLPEAVARRLPPAATWIAAVAAMAAFCWLLKGFFLR